MRPLFLKPTACLLDDIALVAQDYDGVSLPDELARLELLELDRFVEQAEELGDSLAPTESASKRYHGGALHGPFHVLSEAV